MNDVVLTFGTFDGVHLGHRAVLKTAAETGLRPVAVTFSTVPRGDAALMTANEKVAALKECGMDEVVLLDFESVKDMTAEDFLTKLFAEYAVKAAVCGFNFRFGKGGVGDTAFLSDFCRKKGALCTVCTPVCVGGEPISSSRIRNALSCGDMTEATQLLGRPYTLTLPVIHGDARGRTMGFPTINQHPHEHLLLPKFGVYRSETEIDGKCYRSMTNLGFRPSFETETPFAETHLFDFSGDVYGKTVTVSLMQFIREEKKFSSTEELKAAIRADIKSCQN